MGLIMDIAARQKNANPSGSLGEIPGIYREVFEEAIVKTDPQDRKRVMQVIEAVGEGKERKLRNFGKVSAQELTVIVGIWLAGFSDAEFDRLMRMRNQDSGFRTQESGVRKE